MEEFHNNDAGYLSWLDGHADGFVLNVEGVGPGNSMLHTARCSHVVLTNAARLKVTQKPKRCATESASLIAWADEHDQRVTECSTCHPLDSR